MTVKIATWNINSVRSRHERLLAWLERHRPDVLCLQELKAPDDKFPLEEVEKLGYQAAIHGQPSYNGVAILATARLENVIVGLPDHGEGDQARLVAATVGGIRVLSVYVPNGAQVGSEKWDYKLRWLANLEAHLGELVSGETALVVAGDFNIAPDDRDVAYPERWRETVLCHPLLRDWLARLSTLGLEDAFRRHHPDGGVYSWWDYRRLAFPKNDGLRIDLVLASRALVSLEASVDRDERKGKKPSDHAPVIVEFEG